MKKFVLSLGLLMGATCAANAQEARFGIKAGGSLTNFGGKDAADGKSKFGGHGGVFANFGINDMFSIQPEVLFSMKGAKSEDKFTGGGSSVTINSTQSLSYIDVPVLVKASTGDNAGLFFEAGPQVGFLLSANSESKGTNLPAGAVLQSAGNNKSRFNSVDFGYAVGLGYQAEGGPLIGLRYNGGIVNILNNGSTVNQDKTIRNDAFQLYVGFAFGGN